MVLDDRPHPRQPLLADEVRVLDYDNRRLQRPRNLTGLPDPAEWAAGQNDGRYAVYLTQQIAPGVPLARPRRAGKQDPALEALAAGPQPHGAYGPYFARVHQQREPGTLSSTR